MLWKHNIQHDAKTLDVGSREYGPAKVENIRSTHAKHATQHHFLFYGHIQTPQDRHRQQHGRDVEEEIENANEEV